MEENSLELQKTLDLYLPETDYNTAELMICRTCVRPFASYSKFATVCATTEEYITNNCEQINTNSQDLVEDYNTVELMICSSCVGPLASYLKFSTVCATTEQKITKYREQIDTTSHGLVKLNHVRMSYNENEILRKRTLSENIGSNCRQTERFGVKSVPCVVQQKTGTSPLVYRQNSEVIFECKTYHYQTKQNSEVEMFECELCQYKTKRKSDIKRHLLVHRENSEVEMYACEICQYKTKHKDNLKIHLSVHGENSKMEYECDMCPYKTKHIRNVKRHLLVHRKSSEVEMYKCKTCDFKTIRKAYLKQHLLVHMENSEVQMYECETCHYKTKHKGNLKKHLCCIKRTLSLRFVKKIPMYPIYECDVQRCKMTVVLNIVTNDRHVTVI
ncbi:hypothetical protein NQ317_001834 [Molorchus minor]|uniref:C2H2-type domain-containing protein n=1 Tax=Molorchus minor TaxID=1323400 RepID=A0ABQ9JCA3_9CUCU|nr:hypothetical protein NQ317_001834 [Molorchus minor]